MFKIKNNLSPNYLADLFKLPPREGLRSTYFHFVKKPSNATYAEAELSFCVPLL